MKKCLLYFVFFLIGAVAGMWLCRLYSRPQSAEKIVQIDTLVRVDTIREYYPVEISKETIDTMYVHVRDTVWRNNTLYMGLPKEVKVYSGEDYYAEVTGYEPSLYYLEVYPKTTVVTEKVDAARPKNIIGIGVEASYMNATSIPIYLEYTRMLHKNFEIYGQVGYDLPTRTWGVGVGVKAHLSF